MGLWRELRVGYRRASWSYEGRFLGAEAFFDCVELRRKVSLAMVVTVISTDGLMKMRKIEKMKGK